VPKRFLNRRGSSAETDNSAGSGEAKEALSENLTYKTPIAGEKQAVYVLQNTTILGGES
jgi:hypothetical protein